MKILKFRRKRYEEPEEDFCECSCTSCCDAVEPEPEEQPSDDQESNDAIIDFTTIDEEEAVKKTPLDRVKRVAVPAGRAVAAGASKGAEVAGPVLAKGAAAAGKGLLKLAAAGLTAIGKGFTFLGTTLNNQSKLPEDTRSK